MNHDLAVVILTLWGLIGLWCVTWLVIIGGEALIEWLQERHDKENQ